MERDLRLQKGARWFIPASTFPGQNAQQQSLGLGWLATVRALKDGTVTFHCDGDKEREHTESELDEFLEDCTFVEFGRAAAQPQPVPKPLHVPAPRPLPVPQPLAAPQLLPVPQQVACAPELLAEAAPSLPLKKKRRGYQRPFCKINPPKKGKRTGSTEDDKATADNEEESEESDCSLTRQAADGGTSRDVREMSPAAKQPETSSTVVREMPPATKQPGTSRAAAASTPAAMRPDVRKRGIRLPEPEDDRVGTHIKVYLADGGGVWRTAEVLSMKSVLDWSGRPAKGYSLRFHIDGKVYNDVLLDKPWDDSQGFVWEALGKDDELDQAGPGVLAAPPSCSPAPLQPPQQPRAPPTTSSSRKRPRPEVPASQAHMASPWTAPAKKRPEQGWMPHTSVSQCVEDAIEAVLARARDEAAAMADDLPVMRRLRTYEWFAGSARLSLALLKQGCDVMIHDRDPDTVDWAALGMHPDYKCFCSEEFLSVDEGKFYAEPPYDYMHFSIDCSSFTRLGHAGQGRNEGNDFLGDGLRAQDGNQLLYKTVDMIALQQKRKSSFVFTIENPYTGKMKDHPIVQARLEVSRQNGGLGATRLVVDYCRFWDGTGERPFHSA